MSASSFGLAGAAPAANPAVDSVAAAMRPRDLGGVLWSKDRREPWTSARSMALVVVLAAHAVALAGVAFYQRTTLYPEDFAEIPVEIVIEAQPTAVAPTPAQAPVEQPQATVSKVEPPPPVASPAATEPAPAQQEQTANFAIDPPPDAASAPLAVDNDAAARRAAEAARRKRAEIAQQHAQEKAQAERERREQARRLAAEREKRVDMAREARQRVANPAPASAPAREAPRDAFDAASYRRIVAGAVHAAVARSCPANGGGRVVVALAIGASGRVASASLSHPSGNAALDSAAVAAVRRAGPFPAPAGRSSVSVPVAVTCR